MDLEEGDRMISKVLWRTAFLWNPLRYLEGRGQLSRISHEPLRKAIRTECSRWSVRDRLRLVTSRLGPRPDLRFLLTTRIRQTLENEPYFDAGDLRIFFRPDHGVINDEEMLEGALIILAEAYAFSPNFFFGQVIIRPGDVVFDFGGNIGTSAILFARETGPAGRVVSFEPVFHQTLLRNLKENHLSNVEVVPAAVADECGETELIVSERGIDSRIKGHIRESHRIHVPLMTLDQFANDRHLKRLDFLKMDIEGAEEAALRGGEKTIRTLRPKLSIASYHTDFQDDPQHPKLVRLLKKWGYQTFEQGQKHIYAWME